MGDVAALYNLFFSFTSCLCGVGGRRLDPRPFPLIVIMVVVGVVVVVVVVMALCLCPRGCLYSRRCGCGGAHLCCDGGARILKQPRY